jgi:hypothetical protein
MRKDRTTGTTKTTAKQAPKTAKAKATKPETKKTPTKKAQPATQPAKKLSQFQAAIQVLAEAGEPMNCKAMVEARTAKGLWSSPAGKTPEATLHASILRDIRKGEDARFAKADRSLFTLAAKKAKSWLLALHQPSGANMWVKARLGYRIMSWYEDRGLTGTESASRPASCRTVWFVGAVQSFPTCSELTLTEESSCAKVVAPTKHAWALGRDGLQGGRYVRHPSATVPRRLG